MVPAALAALAGVTAPFAAAAQAPANGTPANGTSARPAFPRITAGPGLLAGALLAAPPWDPGSEDDRRRAQLEAITVEIFELGAVELAARAEAHRTTRDGRALLNAIVLRAGRSVPPGLSAARIGQREARAKEALDWLRAEALRGGELDQALRDALVPPPNTVALPDLAIAAMRVAVALDRRQQAKNIATWLDAKEVPGVDEAARDALFRLTGRWFDDYAAFETEWPALEDLSPEASGRDGLVALARERDELLLDVAALGLDALKGDPLVARDPRTAARFAGLLGRAVGGGKLAPERALERLADGLPDEERSEPFHARLRALLDLVQGADPASAPAQRVASVLTELTAPERTLGPDRAWGVIGALPRLAQPIGPEGDAGRAEALGRGLGVLRRVLAEESRRPLDPDGLEGAIRALVDLASSIEDAALRSEAAAPLAEALAALLVTDEPLALSVRRAAAAGLRVSPRPGDASLLLALLQGPRGRALEYELLGGLRATVGVLEPGGAEAEAVLDELFLAAVDRDFDSRMRALNVLASPDLAPALAARSRHARAAAIVRQLPTEEAPEGRRALIELFGRVGDTATLGELLSKSEVLQLIARDGAESTQALGGAVRDVAAGDPRALLAASSELLNAAGGISGKVELAKNAVPSDGAPRLLDPVELRSIRLALLRLGLSLALEAEADGAEVATTVHGGILQSAIELLRVEAALGRTSVLTDAEIVHLADVNLVALEASPSGGELYPFELDAARALIGARRATRALPGAPTPEVIVAAYDRTVAHFSADPDEKRAGWARIALQLDSVRTLRKLGRRAEALSRFDGVLEAYHVGDGSGADRPTLAPTVAREYLELLLASSAADGTAATPDRCTRAAGLVTLLVDEALSTETTPESPGVQWLVDVVGEGGGAGAERFRQVLGSERPELLAGLRDRVAALFGEAGGGDAVPEEAEGASPEGGDEPAPEPEAADGVRDEG